METITLLATIPAILGLTNLAKRFGLTTKWATLLAVGLGIGLNLTDRMLAGADWYQGVGQGLILGMSAAGLYDVAATIGNPARTTSNETSETNN